MSDKEPTDHEVNVRLAEFMGEERCTYFDRIENRPVMCKTYPIKCPARYYCDHGYKKRTESLDLVRGVELEIKQSLSQTTDAKHIKMTRAYFDKLFKGYGRFNLLFADAPHRARACLKVIEENQNARTN